MLYSIGYCLCRWIARIFFALQVEGSEHVPESGPAILAPNHVSYVDPVVIGISVRRRVHFMAKKELFQNRFVGRFLSALQAYPVSRERVDPSTLKRTLSLLAAGQVIVIFPEGTRGKGERLGPPRSGIGVIAARSGAPVVPVFHAGTERVLPRGSRRLRRAPLTIRFGPPLQFPRNAGVSREAIERFGGRLMEAIAALRPSREQVTLVSR